MGAGETFTLLDGLMFSIVSMLLIFVILGVIALLLEGFKWLSREEEVEPAESGGPAERNFLKEDENELLAVITAAIATYENEQEVDIDEKLARLAHEIRAKQVKPIDLLEVKRIQKIEE